MGISKIRTGVTAFILGTVLVVGSAAAASATPSSGSAARTAPAATASFEGCPAGWYCIYPGSGFNGGHPYLMFYTYGNHDLSDVTGIHMWVDNQTGGAWDFECSGYDGTGKTLNYGEGLAWEDMNLTPVNSIRLEATYKPCTG